VRALGLVVALVVAASAQASLVQLNRGAGDGPPALDPYTQLLWLDPTGATTGSPVRARFGTDGAFEGFRRATRDEVATLWMNAGGVDIDLSGSFTEPSYLAAATLVGLINATQLFPIDGERIPSALDALAFVQPNAALDEARSALVLPVPEPSPVALLAVGLSALSAHTRRHDRSTPG
jgi:hypothetical protein